MKRRAFLAASVAAISGTTGCVSLRSSRSGPDDRPDSNETTPALSEDNVDYRDRFSTGGSWPVRGFDAGRRGYNPDAEPPGDRVGAAWLRTPIPGQRTFRTTPPVTDDSRVYVGSSENPDDDRNRGIVAAFEGKTGERAWRTTVSADAIERVAYAGETVLAVAKTHSPASAALVALAATDGRERWRVDLPAIPQGGPVVVGDRAYVTTHDGGLTAVSLDGTRDWEQPIGEGEEYASTAPCTNGSTVFVGTDRGRVVAVAADDGERTWRATVVETGHRPRIQTLPTVADGTVYVSGTDYRLHAVNVADGTERWTTRLLAEDHGNSIPSVSVVGETLYANTIHGGLLALDRHDGSERWRTGKHGGIQPPAVAGGLVVAPVVGGSVQAYTPGGDRQWRFDMPAFEAPGMAAYIMDPEVAVAHDRAYVSLHDGRVFSLGAEDE